VIRHAAEIVRLVAKELKQVVAEDCRRLEVIQQQRVLFLDEKSFAAIYLLQTRLGDFGHLLGQQEYLTAMLDGGEEKGGFSFASIALRTTLESTPYASLVVDMRAKLNAFEKQSSEKFRQSSTTGANAFGTQMMPTSSTRSKRRQLLDICAKIEEDVATQLSGADEPGSLLRDALAQLQDAMKA
ncbi:unnamed protein product, partial [Amoebophrya sp. A25]